MIKARWCRYILRFRFEARTSRETMREKATYFVGIYDDAEPERLLAIGECPLFKGLSADDVPEYETLLSQACEAPYEALELPYSSIRFGFEQVLMPEPKSPWRMGLTGIPINGLIWMGDKDTMTRRIKEKLDSGFRVLKLKIGGINFDDEVELLADIRRRFPASALEIRLDANGSFTAENAAEKLGRLARFDIHSIEQPIKAGQTDAMARLCRESPIAIALDEELIGCRSHDEAFGLVDAIRPQYLILKPALCGGLSGAEAYIDSADRLGIGWWATSALESNIGLAAIGSWLGEKMASEEIMPQGLGTGQLYLNNIASPLELRGNELWFEPSKKWEYPEFEWHG